MPKNCRYFGRRILKIMIDYNYMRPKKAEDLMMRYKDVSHYLGNLSVEIYDNAVALPCKKDNSLFGKGGLIDCEGRLIEESVIPGIYSGVYNYDKLEEKRETVVFCGYFINHWGHFLVEAVSRLWYFIQEDNTQIDKYVFVVGENEHRILKGNYKKFFSLLGILEKIEIINKPTRFSKVILPQRSCKRPYYYADEYKLIFDFVVERNKVDSNWKRYDKIFLTRSQLKKAKETDIGSDMLDSYFKNNGYKIIAPEELDLSEMIFYLRNAKIVAAVAGTLPLNLMFSIDNQKVIMMERVVINNEYTTLATIARNLDVTYIDSYISIYTTDLGSGPFMYFYRGLLEKYTKDNGLNPPEACYLSNAYEKSCFKKYMKVYHHAYGYAWYMYDWAEKDIGAYREAYYDSLKYFSDYIWGLRPFKIEHLFQLRYIKQFVKRILICMRILKK